VLAYTARGFGRSGGLIHLDAPSYEVADASALISYLATLPQVLKDGPGDPRVGVAGSSYGGGLALLVSAYDKRVDAVAADITWNDLSEALFPNAAGGQPGVFKKLWAGELFSSASGQNGGACGRFAPDLCAAYQQAATTGRSRRVDPVAPGGLEPGRGTEPDHRPNPAQPGRAGLALSPRTGAGERQGNRGERHTTEDDLAFRRT